MFTRQLGPSDITVSALGFGCWPIGGLIIEDGKSVGWGQVDEQESIRAIHHAIGLGVTFFDTAEVYGRSEDILGRALVGKRDQVVIATKFGRTYNRERHEIGVPDCRPDSMRRSLEGSLQRLNTDHIDLYQLHAPDCPLEQAMALREALERLVEEGKIRGYGWSTHSIDNARIFADGPHCLAIQQHFNLLGGNGALLAFCEAHHLASINHGPLAMGLLTGKYSANSQLPVDDVRGAGHQWMSVFPAGSPHAQDLARLAVIRDILMSNGRTPAQGALAWLWGRSHNTIPIPGFKNSSQAEENARALEFGPLTAEQMAQIAHQLEQINE